MNETTTPMYDNDVMTVADDRLLALANSTLDNRLLALANSTLGNRLLARANSTFDNLHKEMVHRRCQCKA